MPLASGGRPRGATFWLVEVEVPGAEIHIPDACRSTYRCDARAGPYVEHSWHNLSRPGSILYHKAALPCIAWRARADRGPPRREVARVMTRGGCDKKKALMACCPVSGVNTCDAASNVTRPAPGSARGRGRGARGARRRRVRSDGGRVSPPERREIRDIHIRYRYDSGGQRSGVRREERLWQVHT